MRGVLERLDPNHWALEWYLSWWLGDAFGLEEEIATDLVVSSVLGLIWVRLGDDLVDGAVREDPGGRVEATRQRAFHAAIDGYRRWLPATSPFWTDLDHAVELWRAATEGPARDSGSGALGAPIRIPAAAALHLAGRADVLSGLYRCLEHLLEALVLLDHAHDWRDDLRAGRANRFARAVLRPAGLASFEPGAATPGAALSAATRRAESYAARIATHAEAATSEAERLGVPGLIRYAHRLADQARQEGERLRASAAPGLTSAATMRRGAVLRDDAGQPPARDAMGSTQEGARMADQEEPTTSGSEGPMATPEQRERLAGKALVDDTFRSWLRSDPRAAAAYMGVTLTEREMERLQRIDWERFDELAIGIQNAVGFQADSGWG